MHWHYLVSHLIRTPFANRYLNCTRNRKANNNGLFTQLALMLPGIAGLRNTGLCSKVMQGEYGHR